MRRSRTTFQVVNRPSIFQNRSLNIPILESRFTGNDSKNRIT